MVATDRGQKVRRVSSFPRGLSRDWARVRARSAFRAFCTPAKIGRVVRRRSAPHEFRRAILHADERVLPARGALLDEHRAAAVVGHRPRVLYVDDEPDVREVFAEVFAGDFEVTLVEAGRAALEKLAASAFDVLVSDMRMEPMRGSELLAQAFERFPSTRASCSPDAPITTTSPTR